VIFLQPVDLETLKKQFKDYDVDGNGVLDKDELCEIFKKNGKSDSEAKAAVDEFFKKHDHDGDGQVTWAEFLKTYE